MRAIIDAENVEEMKVLKDELYRIYMRTGEVSENFREEFEERRNSEKIVQFSINCLPEGLLVYVERYLEHIIEVFKNYPQVEKAYRDAVATSVLETLLNMSRSDVEEDEAYDPNYDHLTQGEPVAVLPNKDSLGVRLMKAKDASRDFYPQISEVMDRQVAWIISDKIPFEEDDLDDYSFYFDLMEDLIPYQGLWDIENKDGLEDDLERLNREALRMLSALWSPITQAELDEQQEVTRRQNELQDRRIDVQYRLEREDDISEFLDELEESRYEIEEMVEDVWDDPSTMDVNWDDPVYDDE